MNLSTSRVQNRKQEVFNWLYRQSFKGTELKFEEVLRQAAKESLHLEDLDIESFVQANIHQYWNWLKQEVENDEKIGIWPVFVIGNNSSQTIYWQKVKNQKNASRSRKIKQLLPTRPSILRTIDALSSREYEALSAVICKMLGADNVVLTPPGNEGGVDFLASIEIPRKSHVWFGSQSPLRVIGQCKKYTNKVQVDKVRDFITAINDIKHQNKKLDQLVPAWFRASKGPIIGWIIAHSGFQSGTISTAKNHGIVLSDSRDLCEIATFSNFLTTSKNYSRSDNLKKLTQLELKFFSELKNN